MLNKQYPYPFQVKIKYCELQKITDEEIDNIMNKHTFLSLGVKHRVALDEILKQKQGGQIMAGKGKAPALSPEKRAYAMDIYNRPMIPITVRDESLGHSAAKGHSIRSSLQVNGLVKSVILGLPGKGFIKLLELTEQGLKELGCQMNRDGQGGQLHRSFQQETKSDAESKGYQATIEMCLKTKRVDVGIETDSGTVAVEICLSIPDKEFRNNIIKDLKTGFVQVIACCKDQLQIRALQAMVDEKLPEDLQAKVSFFLLSHYVVNDSESVCNLIK